MSKLTKFLALMMAVLFALSLVACGGDEPNTKETTKASGQVTNANDASDSTVTEKDGKVVTKVTTKGITTKANNNNKVTKTQGETMPKATAGSLIQRTTNKAGNASASFVKSLKGFNLKILYPWENIYGDKKCQTTAVESINEVQKLYGVKITEEAQFNRYNESLAAELSAKKCDNHIYYAQEGNFASYFSKNYIADLTSGMREAGIDFNDPWYISNAKGFLNIDGKQYGWIAYEDEYTMPFCIVYNRNLLNKKRLTEPSVLAEQGKWTWDTLEKYAKKFENDASVTGFYGEASPILLEAIANQYGTTLTKASRGTQPTTNITDTKVQAALTELGAWTGGKKPWCETFSGKAWNFGKNQLYSGKVAMAFGTHDLIQGFASTSIKSDIGIAPFPNKTASTTYTGVSTPQFIAFVPIVHQKDVSKILFIRNEYYRYNYRYVQQNFQYKWENYLGEGNEAIVKASKIKYAQDGNKVIFCWTSISESSDASTKTQSIISAVVSGKETAAQAISSKKNALTKSYNDVWKGHITTGEV